MKNSRLKSSIAISKSGGHYVYVSGRVTLEPEHTELIWECWEDFMASMTFGEMLTFNERSNYIGKINKKWNKIDFALALWDAMFNRAGEQGHIRQEEIKPTHTEDGKRIRKRKKLNTRIYQLIVVSSEDHAKRLKVLNRMPPQAQIIWDIIKDIDEQINEVDLIEEINKNGHLLNTRQQPWRVFQYYRAEFISNKFFRVI